MKNLRRPVFVCPVRTLWNLAESLAAACFLSWFFYRSAWGLLLFAPLAARGFCRAGRALEKKRRGELERQFQECILSAAAGMRAGYSIENAFCESMGDMRMMFGSRGRIVRELEEVMRGLRNHIPLERLFMTLGEKSGSVYILEFAEILAIAHQSGGNPAEVIADTAEALSARWRTAAEIEVLLSGRKLEGKIMNWMPFLLVLYVRLGTPEYFDVLYHNPAGITVMTLLAAVYLISTLLTEKITDIRVGQEP